MKFNTKVRYAVRAMLEISLGETGVGVFQKDISKNQELSIKYLDHIIPPLKVAGLIANIRGKKSGYILTRKPAEITLLDIHNAFEHGLCIVDCMETTHTCSRMNICAVRGFWEKLNINITEYLESVTLQDLKNQQILLDKTKSSEGKPS
jgi:Rrf2 family protein